MFLKALAMMMAFTAASLLLRQEARRLAASQDAELPVAEGAARRFVRRTKVLMLLLGLFALSLYYEEAVRAIPLTARGVILYTGLALVVLIWILLLAGQEVREQAQRAVVESRDLRAEAAARVEEAMRQRQVPPPGGEQDG